MQRILLVGLLACGRHSPTGDPVAETPVPPAFGLDERPANKTCAPPAKINAPAPTLSGTGCATGLVPYDIQSPLWSDGADKQRWFALPDDTSITVTETGDFDLPEGSVAVKEFSFAGTRVETRLLVRYGPTQYKGYSYAWREDQSDADVMPDGVNGVFRDVNTAAGVVRWYFPTRGDCLTCHTKPAGVWLGLQLDQLSAVARYGERTADQVATLQHVTLLPGTLPAVTRMPNPEDEAVDVATRARAYLAANCAHCHQPGAPQGDIDLRFTTPLIAAGICDVPSERALNAYRLVPGHPNDSTLLQRMRLLGNVQRMPPLASGVLDPRGIALVERWIAGLSGCQ